MPSKIAEAIAHHGRRDSLGTIVLAGTAGIDLDALQKTSAGKLVAIEPNSALWPALEEAKCKRLELWKAGIAASAGEAPFYSYNFPRLSSLCPPSEALRHLFPGLRQIGAQTIQTLTLSSILEQASIPTGQQNSLVVNAPGAERQILEDVLAPRWLGLFSLLLLRCPREPLYEGSSCYREALGRLEAEGYRLEGMDDADPDFPVALLRFEPLFLEVRQLRSELERQAARTGESQEEERRLEEKREGPVNEHAVLNKRVKGRKETAEVREAEVGELTELARTLAVLRKKVAELEEELAQERNRRLENETSLVRVQAQVNLLEEVLELKPL